jgi:hypothetical protein
MLTYSSLFIVLHKSFLVFKPLDTEIPEPIFMLEKYSGGEGGGREKIRRGDKEKR